jgi:D-lactate dehydrogenase
MNKLLGDNMLRNITSGIRTTKLPFPLWINGLKASYYSESYLQTESATKIVLYTTCIHRMMGGNKEKNNLTDTLISVSQKTNIQVLMYNNAGSCCGQAFSSKGFPEAATLAASQSISSLWKLTESGKYPVVMDTTSCANTLANSQHLLGFEDKSKLEKMRILDVTEFAYEYILPKIKVLNKKKSIALHPVCSLEKMKLKGKLIEVAKACADEVIVPKHAGCCGMAGDRGFFFPELTNAATKMEADEIRATSCDGHYSTGRTCEIALTEATGKEYVSLLYLLDEVS